LHHNDSVILTEKYDGTTVQATKYGVFKRKDKFQVGDLRKHDVVDESERYDVERIDLENGCKHGINLYIKQAVLPYLEIFKQFDKEENDNGVDGGGELCCYFEAYGTNIQSRFNPKKNQLENDNNEMSNNNNNNNDNYNDKDEVKVWHDIKVFDFSRNGKYLNWSSCQKLAKKYNLPLVASFSVEKLDLYSILLKLKSRPFYQSPYSNPSLSSSLLPRVESEGYVIRQVKRKDIQYDTEEAKVEEKVCKIRVCDLEKIKLPALVLTNTKKFSVFTLFEY
jgi:hypothetical protein